VLLAVLSILNAEVFGGYIASVLPSGIDIGFLFKGIIEKLNQLSS
jgi:hypothetical protein